MPVRRAGGTSAVDGCIAADASRRVGARGGRLLGLQQALLVWAQEGVPEGGRLGSRLDAVGCLVALILGLLLRTRLVACAPGWSAPARSPAPQPGHITGAADRCLRPAASASHPSAASPEQAGLVRAEGARMAAGAGQGGTPSASPSSLTSAGTSPAPLTCTDSLSRPGPMLIAASPTAPSVPGFSICQQGLVSRVWGMRGCVQAVRHMATQQSAARSDLLDSAAP